MRWAGWGRAAIAAGTVASHSRSEEPPERRLGCDQAEQVRLVLQDPHVCSARRTPSQPKEDLTEHAAPIMAGWPLPVLADDPTQQVCQSEAIRHVPEQMQPGTAHNPGLGDLDTNLGNNLGSVHPTGALRCDNSGRSTPRVSRTRRASSRHPTPEPTLTRERSGLVRIAGASEDVNGIGGRPIAIGESDLSGEPAT